MFSECFGSNKSIKNQKVTAIANVASDDRTTAESVDDNTTDGESNSSADGQDVVSYDETFSDAITRSEKIVTSSQRNTETCGTFQKRLEHKIKIIQETTKSVYSLATSDLISIEAHSHLYDTAVEIFSDVSEPIVDAINAVVPFFKVVVSIGKLVYRKIVTRNENTDSLEALVDRLFLDFDCLQQFFNEGKLGDDRDVYYRSILDFADQLNSSLLFVRTVSNSVWNAETVKEKIAELEKGLDDCERRVVFMEIIQSRTKLHTFEQSFEYRFDVVESRIDALESRIESNRINPKDVLERVCILRLSRDIMDQEFKVHSYIPQFYSDSDNKPSDTTLDEKIKSLLTMNLEPNSENSKHNVILVQGGAGVGKTMFGWKLYSSHNSYDQRIPLFIHLPKYRDLILSESQKSTGTMIKEYLKDVFRLTDDEINVLDRQYSPRFLFIFDSYDEVGTDIHGNKPNISNQYTWPDALFMISSRSGVLTSADIQDRIQLRHKINNQPYGDVIKIFIQPFTSEQVKKFIEVYSSFKLRNRPYIETTKYDYYHAYQNTFKLNRFGTEPLTVIMILEILPSLMQGGQENEFLKRVDKITLKVDTISQESTIEHFVTLRRMELYALFIDYWVSREAQKKDTRRNDMETMPASSLDILEWSCELAYLMWVQNVNVLKKKPIVHRGRLPFAFGMSSINKNADTDFDNPFNVQLDESFGKILKSNLMSTPVRKVGEEYKFIHETFREYLCAYKIAAQLVIVITEGALDTVLFSDDVKFFGLANVNLDIKDNKPLLRFLGEFVDPTIRDYYPTITGQVDTSNKNWQPFGKALFDIVEICRQQDRVLQSPNCLYIAQAAANALMILTSNGNIPFTGRDFSHAVLADPNSHSKSDSAFLDLSGAYLRGCKFDYAYLYNARLEDCVLTDVSFTGAYVLGHEIPNTSIYDGHNGIIYDLKLSSDGELLYSCSVDKTIRAWSTKTSGYVKVFKGHTSEVNAICLSADNLLLYSSSDDTTIKQWSTDSVKCVKTYKGHEKRVNCICLSDDGLYLYSGSSDQTLRKWSVEDGKWIVKYEGHEASVTTICLTPDGKSLISGSRDSAIKIWSLETNACVGDFSGHRDQINALLVSSDGMFLFSGSDDQTIRLWSIEKNVLIRELIGHEGQVRKLTINENGKFVYSVSADRTIRKWIIESGDLVSTYEVSNSVTSMIFGLDQMSIYCGLKTGNIVHSHLDTMEHVLFKKQHSDDVLCLCLSRDGKHAFSSSADYKIFKWSTETGQCERPYEDHKAAVNSICLAADGLTFFSASDDCTIKQWPAIAKGGRLRNYQSLTGPVKCICVCPNGEFLYSGSRDMTVQQWSVETQSVLYRFAGHKQRVVALCINSDGLYFFSGSLDKTIRQWNTKTREIIRVYSHETGRILCVGISFDNCSIACGTSDNTIHVWSTESGNTLGKFDDHSDDILSICFGPDNKSIFSGSSDNTLRKWSLNSAGPNSVLQHFQDAVYSVCIDSSSHHLYSALGNGNVNHLLISRIEKEHVYGGHTDSVRRICLSFDGNFLFSGSDDGTIIQWATQTRINIRHFTKHDDEIRGLCVSPDGEFMYSASAESIRQWTIETGKYREILGKQRVRIVCMILGKDAKSLLTGSQNHTIYEWSIETSENLGCYIGHYDKVNALVLCKDGDVLLSGSDDGSINIWSTKNHECMYIINNQSSVNALCISNDGKYVFSGSDDAMIRQWSIESKECVREFSGHGKEVYGISLSPQDKYLFSVSVDKTVRRWSIDSGKCLRVYEGRGDSVMCVCVSSDGKWVYSGDGANTIHQHSTESDECVRTNEGHTGRVMSVLLSDDEKYLFSGSRDFTVRQWSLESRECIRVFKGHTNSVNSICLTSDCAHVFSASDDCTVRQWQVDTGVCILTCDHKKEEVNIVCVGKSNKYMYSCTKKGVRQWLIKDGELVRFIEIGYPISLCLSADEESFFVLAAESRRMRLFLFDDDDDDDDYNGTLSIQKWSITDARKLESESKFHSPAMPVCMCLSSDEKTLYTASNDGFIREWSTETCSCLKKYTVIYERIHELNVCADGTRLYAALTDSTVRQLTIGHDDVRVYDGHIGSVYSVCATRDGKYIFSGSSDSSIFVHTDISSQPLSFPRVLVD